MSLQESVCRISAHTFPALSVLLWSPVCAELNSLLLHVREESKNQYFNLLLLLLSKAMPEDNHLLGLCAQEEKDSVPTSSNILSSACTFC